MMPGVVRALHAHERVQVGALLGLCCGPDLAGHGWYGFVYVDWATAERMTDANRAQGWAAYGPAYWQPTTEEQPVPVSLLDAAGTPWGKLVASRDVAQFNAQDPAPVRAQPLLDLAATWAAAADRRGDSDYADLLRACRRQLLAAMGRPE